MSRSPYQTYDLTIIIQRSYSRLIQSSYKYMVKETFNHIRRQFVKAVYWIIFGWFGGVRGIALLAGFHLRFWDRGFRQFGHA